MLLASRMDRGTAATFERQRDWKTVTLGEVAAVDEGTEDQMV
jgi:hypothetical protein